ncbi:hypothetical protein HRbin37_02420 [bacterium HR37]|nr:hypothetical protein HRbin37_02420 [bacterium HR37]
MEAASSTAYATPLIFLVALLYSMVGHGGGSGYIAVLTFLHGDPDFISTTGLSLNLMVSSIAFLNFRRSGHFDHSILLPFVITSIPASFVGGYIRVEKTVFSLILGTALLLSAVRLFLEFSPQHNYRNRVPLYGGLILGLLIGFVSGVTGIGGGVFLSPLLIFLRWADPKKTAAASSAFIFINSLSGLGARFVKFGFSLPYTVDIGVFAVAVVIGGYIGSFFASHRFKVPVLQKALALTLTVAGIKLLIAR